MKLPKLKIQSFRNLLEVCLYKHYKKKTQHYLYSITLNLASNDKSFKLASPYFEINFIFKLTQQRIA